MQAWFRICKLGEDVTPYPCVDGANEEAGAEAATDTSNDIPLETASSALVAFVSNVNTYLGLRWLDSYRAWVETASQSSGQACEAAFVTGFAICDIGPFVTFPGNDPHGKQINAGCGCGGIYVRGHLRCIQHCLKVLLCVYF